MVKSSGLKIKKQYGQHFLRKQSVVDHMIEKVGLDKETSVFEIGCGDGFLTGPILEQNIARLWVFEIDPDWADFVREKYKSDKKLTVYLENFLDIDFSTLESYKPWVVLANLPYQVTFPILYRFQQHRHLIKEGVVMVQEEVAQKIVKKGGRGYGYPSLFLQYFFDWELMEKVRPDAFEPPPKVDSRLIYFKTKQNVQDIPNSEEFWKFIKMCFLQPRRTLLNNLKQAHYPFEKIDENILKLRAQQMQIQDFLDVWKIIS
ncbi:MAG: 16S ribosomal RNA methyltransferase KsgA/Dim1 family protein [candidate division TM6 bacterium GW2011_GWF2_32_72]|nr:MAG: 16S ribosomal RNA methyltransferase KsgA/Dim1 family protein [candidate division TM6 bacterium GW2011_GWF2_32_72]